MTRQRKDDLRNFLMKITTEKSDNIESEEIILQLNLNGYQNKSIFCQVEKLINDNQIILKNSDVNHLAFNDETIERNIEILNNLKKILK